MGDFTHIMHPMGFMLGNCSDARYLAMQDLREVSVFEMHGQILCPFPVF